RGGDRNAPSLRRARAGFSPRRRVPLLVVQAADDELGTVARQDFLFGGLPLAIVHPFFFLRALCGKFLIFRCNDRRLTWPDITVKAMNNELRTVAREDFLLGRPLLAVVYSFPFFCPLRNHVLIFRRHGRSALGLPNGRSRYHDQRHRN